ncbi:MAG: STAS domain-containing protein [Clostridiales bacterium]|jgi:stage II sporulation protein AA (anti-sigma F factor antagonist)|nr:STAS domain-containing protein [Clostridiales bacterium]
MSYRIETEGDTMTAWLGGELDHHTAAQMREQVDAAVDRLKPHQLRLDFSGISFMDSSGVGLIMGRYRLMNMLGGGLTVTGCSDRVRKMLMLAGLERLNILE